MNIPWTDVDRDTLKKMRRERFSHKHIARVLGRSPRAVMAKAEEMGAVKGRGKTPVEIAAADFRRLTVTKEKLPAHYAAGWRVAWFEGNQVGLEWRKGDTSLSLELVP